MKPNSTGKQARDAKMTMSEAKPATPVSGKAPTASADKAYLDTKAAANPSAEVKSMIDKVIAATFAIGSALGATAGVMVAANYGQADPYMGFLLGLKAFSAAVLGGIGNLAGAVVGGLLLGLIESLGAGYLGTLTNGVFGSNYQDIFAFLVLVTVLVLRPSGLLGERTAERA